MSASPIARQACSHAQIIPSKRVLITDATELPDVYASTPGGTLYSTTPGGTRIIYERAFLMNLKNSPLARTPPSSTLPSALLRNSPNARFITNKQTNHQQKHNNHHHYHRRSPPKVADDHQEQFQLEL